MSQKTEDVLDWFLTLQPEVRRRVLDSPAEISPRRVEKRAELAEWIDRVKAEEDVHAVTTVMMDRGLGEDDAEEVVHAIAGFDAGHGAEDVAEDRPDIFELVGRDVLSSYTGSEDAYADDETREAIDEFDVEDVADLRLLLSRTVVAVSCGDIDEDDARSRLRKSGASEQAVDEFVDELLSRLDEVDTHLRGVRLDSLSQDIRNLRWDSLGR